MPPDRVVIHEQWQIRFTYTDLTEEPLASEYSPAAIRQRQRQTALELERLAPRFQAGLIEDYLEAVHKGDIRRAFILKGILNSIHEE